MTRDDAVFYVTRVIPKTLQWGIHLLRHLHHDAHRMVCFDGAYLACSCGRVFFDNRPKFHGD